MTRLSCRNITLGYDNKDIIKNLSLDIQNEEIVTITGPNGSGKSTILRALSRNLKPRKGIITLDQIDIHTLKPRTAAKKMSFLPQSPLAPPYFTVGELVSYGRFPHRLWSGSLTKEDHKKVDWALKVTGMAGFSERDLTTLSGGERQRAWIAMVLAQEADILLFDEPTTYLDIHHQLEILELIRELNKDMKRTIVMVLHDLNQAARYSDRIVVVNEGSIYTEGDPWDVITETTLKEVFRIEANIMHNHLTDSPAFIALESL